MDMKSEIKNLGLHGEDLHGFNVIETEKAAAEEEIWFGASSNLHHHGGADCGDGGGDELLDDPSSLFYTEDFPPLPDFPCMSSSSSTSSTPPPVAKAATATASSSASTASSSRPAASWAVLKSDADHDPSSSSMDFLIGTDDYHAPPHEAADDGLDLMENFGSCIDLLETSDICWDPSPLFEDEPDPEPTRLLGPIQEDQDQDHQQQRFVVEGGGGGGGVADVGGKEEAAEDDLAVVFFEWLKSNKEMISAEDLRNIKIKKSTIEAAAKRLGGGKEGMKQLLKLILQWVQNHHLQNKKKESQSPAVSLTNTTCAPPPLVVLDQDTNLNSNTINITNTTTNNNNNSTTTTTNNNLLSCSVPPPQVAPTAWMPVSAPPPPPQFVGDPAAMGFLPMMGYMGPPLGHDPYASTEQYHHMMETAKATTAPLTWAPSPAAMQFGMGPPHYSPCPYPPDPAAAHGFGGYGSPYPAAPGFYYHPGLGEGLVRLGASATKEARRKRMARQRRFLSHHHRSHHHQHNQSNNNNQVQVHHQQINHTVEQHPHQHPGAGNIGGVAAPHPAHGNWVYWPQLPPPPPPPQASVNPGPVLGQMQIQMQMQQPLEPPAGPPPGNGFQRQVGVDKKQQGWKTEKNLRFLLQKVLKQSDVGNLGRIVLPKKEAETHLPELEARDGIPIAMEDIGTSRVWNMRYRFWPNNKSRMYLLENTGDFVRTNGLQEGDFIVIYSDLKCGKYMIRGVKVRQQQQQGAKPETPNKKPYKTQKTQGSSSPSGPSSSSPTKQ